MQLSLNPVKAIFAVRAINIIEEVTINNKKSVSHLLVSLLASLSMLTTQLAFAAESSLVKVGSDGKLDYTPFAMTDQTNQVNVIPDYSHAGYKGGGVAIPDAPVKITLYPQSGDDRAQIQAAIDQVEAMPLDENGFRGAVLLSAGAYEIDAQLTIQASGVVLRGEGQGSNGTVITATSTILGTKFDHDNDALYIHGPSAYVVDDSSVTRITSSYVPVGSYSFNVASSAGYSVGDDIVVKMTRNNFWVDDLTMTQWGWTASSYSINHQRVISSISGNTVTVNIPIVDVIEDQYGGAEIYQIDTSGNISQVGVENLRFESVYASKFDENHAWNAIITENLTNSWVKQVTCQYFAKACVHFLDSSSFITVEEVAMLDYKSQISGGRRYGFDIRDGLGILVQRSYTREGRHDYALNSRTTGPNVFLDSYSTNTHADIGPHARWSTGVLFDNIRGGEIRVRNRKDSGSGHGYSGAQVMFWNCHSYQGDVWVESPKGAMNWAIGCGGGSKNNDSADSGFFEQWNNAVMPRSLYLKQLEDRLGSPAVANVTTTAQRKGSIWNDLQLWAGEGKLDGGAVNELPVVNAGSNQTITLPSNSVTVSAVCTDIDNGPGSLTCTWSGSTGVSFANINALTTTATFSDSGSYTVTMTAYDTLNSSADSATITVTTASPANIVPAYNGGMTQRTANTYSSFSYDISSSFSDADANGDDTLSFSATGLPSGLSISSAGLISGSSSTEGTFIVIVTATDTSNSAVSGSFSMTINEVVVDDSGGGGGSFDLWLLVLALTVYTQKNALVGKIIN